MQLEDQAIAAKLLAISVCSFLIRREDYFIFKVTYSFHQQPRATIVYTAVNLDCFSSLPSKIRPFFFSLYIYIYSVPPIRYFCT